MSYLRPLLFGIFGMSRGCRWAGSAGGPPLRLLRIDPWEDGRVGIRSPQRTFGDVFPARTRRRLRSSPRQMIPRISLELRDFSTGLPPRRGRRCGLQGAPPTESVPCLAWHSASAAARGPIPDQDSWALAQDLPLTSGIQPGVSAAAGPPRRGRRRGLRGTPPTALMPSLAQRSACAAVWGTNFAQGPLICGNSPEKNFRLGYSPKLFVSKAALQAPPR